VKDGSKSGLNVELWAPWFALLMMTKMSSMVLSGYWCTNNNYGKMFLNFPLYEDLPKYCGVNLSQFFYEK
jgi:hypothetical protein